MPLYNIADSRGETEQAAEPSIPQPVADLHDALQVVAEMPDNPVFQNAPHDEQEAIIGRAQQTLDDGLQQARDHFDPGAFDELTNHVADHLTNLYGAVNRAKFAPKGAQPESAWASFGTELKAGFPESAATAVGGMSGAALAAPSGPVGMFAADIAAGQLAGTAMAKAQQASDPEGYAKLQEQRRVNAQANPIATRIASTGNMLLAALGGGTAKPVFSTAGRFLGRATTEAAAKDMIAAAAKGIIHKPSLLERVAPLLAKGARVGASGASQRKYVQGEKDVSVIDEAARTGLGFAATGLIGWKPKPPLTGFVPVAKQLLTDAGVHGVTDAALMTVTNNLYDSFVHGKPFSVKKFAQEAGAESIPFAVQNLLMRGAQRMMVAHATANLAAAPHLDAAQQARAAAAKAEADGFNQTAEAAQNLAQTHKAAAEQAYHDTFEAETKTDENAPPPQQSRSSPAQDRQPSAPTAEAGPKAEGAAGGEVVATEEHIVAAALKDPESGRVFTGATHGYANPRDRAQLNLGSAKDPQEHIGYVTNTGRWVSQEEAANKWGIEGSETSAAYWGDPLTKDAALGRGNEDDRFVEPISEAEYEAELSRRKDAERTKFKEYQAKIPTPEPKPVPPVSEIVPAIRVAGELVRGKFGDAHRDILERWKEGKSEEDQALAEMDFDTKENPNLFVGEKAPDSEAFGRKELKAAHGVPDAQQLRDLQAKEKPTVALPAAQPPAESPTAKPAEPTVAKSAAVEPVKPKRSEDLRAEMDRLEKERNARVASVLKDAGKDGGVELQSETAGHEDKRLLITPEVGGDGSWRVTKVDKDGPYGHNVFKSREAALRASAGESHTDMVPGPGYFAFGPYKVLRTSKKIAAPAAKEPAPATQANALRAKIVPGASVEVTLRKGSNKVHKATVLNVDGDQVQVKFGKSDSFKGGETQYVPISNVAPPKAARTRMLNESQFEGMTPEQKKKTKADAKEFDDLVAAHPELGWYDWRVDEGTGKSGDMARNEERKRASVEAMKALGGDPLWVDANNSVMKAELLPKLRDLVNDKAAEWAAEVPNEYLDDPSTSNDFDTQEKADAFIESNALAEPGATQELPPAEAAPVGQTGQADTEGQGAAGKSAEVEVPKLRKSDADETGQLLQGSNEPFNLVEETAADIAKREKREASEQAAKEAKEASEAKAKADKEQTNLFGGIAGSGTLLPYAQSNAPIVPIKPMSEIIRDIARGIGIPIRFGRLTTSKFAGYFKKLQNLIGAKSANDIEIVSHEVGHKLDETFGMSKNPAIRAEIEKLGDPATPGSRSSWTKSKTLAYKHGEGVAEFVRHWITDPAKAAADAPATNRYFEQVMDANPDFGDVMKRAQQDVQTWRNAPAEVRLDSNISVGDNPNQTRYRLPQLTRDLVDDLHILRLAFDDLKKLTGKEAAPSDNGYLLARLLRGSYGMADTFIRHGTVDFKTRAVKLGNSFEHALKPVAGRINEFRRWIIAKRATELESQGRETGLVPADVAAVNAKYASEPGFQDAFDKLKLWNDSLLQYAVDSGYVSQESADAMRAMNQDYVPFHRIFEIGAGESPSQQGGGGGRGLNVGKAGSLKRLHGSQRDIVDPLETMIKNAYVFVTASEKAAINRAIANLSNAEGMGKWVEEIATPKEAVKVELEKVREELEAAGADLSAVPDDLVMQFFQNSGRVPFGENIIKVTSGGETKFYRLKSDLFDAFHALDLDDSSKLIQVLSQPAQVLRAGVTLDPAFALANVMRDAVGSAVINRYGMLPFEASVRGVAALLKNPKLVAEWAASGGEQSFESSFFDRTKMAKFMRERITKDMTKAEQAMIVLKSPLAFLRYISGMAESATRIGEYERSYKEAIKGGMSEGDARRLASFESRGRQDFAKGGAKTKILRHAAAFWNAGLQGNIAVAQAFRNRPIRTTLQGLAYITIPTMIAMALNHDDKDYWDRPQWERDAFWLIPVGKDANNASRFLRIPKPFILGIMFGALPERMMGYAMKKDPTAFKGAMNSVLQDIVPNPMPQVGQVIISDVFTGKQGWDMWRNRPVVPESLKDLPPELQWTEQTSLTAKHIGKLLGLSPLKIDHIIAGTTGGLGKQIVHNAIDRAIGAATGEEPTATRVVPGMRFLTVPAGISSEAVTDFYDNLTALREQKAGRKVSGKAMAGKDLRKLETMEHAADLMSKLRKLAHKAKEPDEKQKFYLRIRDLAAKYK